MARSGGTKGLLTGEMQTSCWEHLLWAFNTLVGRLSWLIENCRKVNDFVDIAYLIGYTFSQLVSYIVLSLTDNLILKALYRYISCSLFLHKIQKRIS